MNFQITVLWGVLRIYEKDMCMSITCHDWIIKSVQLPYFVSSRALQGMPSAFFTCTITKIMQVRMIYPQKVISCLFQSTPGLSAVQMMLEALDQISSHSSYHQNLHIRRQSAIISTLCTLSGYTWALYWHDEQSLHILVQEWLWWISWWLSWWECRRLKSRGEKSLDQIVSGTKVYGGGFVGPLYYYYYYYWVNMLVEFK